MIQKIIFSLFLSILLVTRLAADVLADVQLKQVVSGLSIPWGMAFVSDNELLVTEKKGSLKIVDLSVSPVKILPVKGLPDILEVGQGGLLDIKVAPSYDINLNLPIVYFTFVGQNSVLKQKNIPTLKLAKAVLKGDSLIDVKVIFEANNPQKGGRHFGSRIAFDGQGHVFVSMGDRGQRENAQDLSKHSGSILRLNLDGSIPNDNPFVNDKAVMPEIWSYGHRNPQGLAFDPLKQKLWSIEHGPRGGDEINVIEKGRNYGWPVISYGREYISNRKVGESTFKEGMQQPVYYFTPSIAPSSLLVYSGKKIQDWKGVLLSGALKLQHLNLVVVGQDDEFISEKRFFEGEYGRLRNVVENLSGDIYIATDNGDIFELQF